MKKNVKKIIIYIFFVCLISISAIGCMGNSIKLLLNLKKGDAFKVEVENNQRISQNIKGQNMSINSKIRMACLCNVLSIDENKNADIKVTFDSVDIKFQGINGQTGINNAKVDNKVRDKLSKFYGTLVGKSFKIKIGEYGRVKSIMGMDTIIKNILKELNITDKKEQEGIKKILRIELRDEAISKKIERFTLVYPNKDVSVGDVWKKDSYISSEFPVRVENEYTLKDNENKTSEILIKGKILTEKSKEPVKGGEIKIDYEDLTGDQKGTVILNEGTGLIRHADISSRFSGNMKVYPKDPNEGMKMFPITVQDNIVINVLRQ